MTIDIKTERHYEFDFIDQAESFIGAFDAGEIGTQGMEDQERIFENQRNRYFLYSGRRFRANGFSVDVEQVAVLQWGTV